MAFDRCCGEVSILDLFDIAETSWGTIPLSELQLFCRPAQEHAHAQDAGQIDLATQWTPCLCRAEASGIWHLAGPV